MLFTTLPSSLLLLAHNVVGHGWAKRTNPNSTVLSNASMVSNTSTPTNGPNNPDSTLAINSSPVANITHCKTAYPSELRHMNSLYPNTTYYPTTLSLALHESNNSFQVATQVQFNGLPFPVAAQGEKNKESCVLQLKVPSPETMKTNGPWPLLNVYQVSREPGALTSWNTYAARNVTGNETGVPSPLDTPLAFPQISSTEEGDNDVTLFIGRVNGDAIALQRTRANGGLMVVNTVECNETLTFQMGMTLPNDSPVVNFWEFVNVVPPQMPAQGWMIVYGC